jgi:hypothetical protein
MVERSIGHDFLRKGYTKVYMECLHTMHRPESLPRRMALLGQGLVHVPLLYRQQETPPWLEQAPLPVAELIQPSVHVAPIL